MSDTLALLALMNKGEGLTEEQVNQLINDKNLQPKLTAGDNITISENNVISATDTGLTQEQVNQVIDSKNLQPKLTAGTNITIEGNVISSSGGGSTYTFSDGLTETGGNVTWDLNDRIEKGNLEDRKSIEIGDIATQQNNGYYSVTMGTNTSGYKLGISVGTSGYGCLAGGCSSGGGSYSVISTGKGSMAFGCAESNTIRAEGDGSHAEGYTGIYGQLTATKQASHAEGAGTNALSKHQHVEGRSNVPDLNDIFQHITGNGSDKSNRSNAEALDWSGNKFLAGNVYVGCTDYTTSADGLVTENCGGKKLITEAEANTIVDNKNLQPKLTAGDNITISADNVISATASGGGSSYTSLKEQTIEGSQPGLIITNQEDLSKVSSKDGSLILTQNDSSSSIIKSEASGQSILSVTNTTIDHEKIEARRNSIVGVYANGSTNYSTAQNSIVSAEIGSYGMFDVQDNSILGGYIKNGVCNLRNQSIAVGIGDNTVGYLGQVGTIGNIHCTQTFGTGVQAGSNNQMVIGKCNILDSSGNYVFMIGNGSDNNNRSNALTVDWSGNLVCNNIPAAPTADGNYVLKCSIVSGVPTYSWVAEQ